MRVNGYYSAVFITPNGFRWFVFKDSPYTQWMRLLLKSASEKEEYADTRG